MLLKGTGYVRESLQKDYDELAGDERFFKDVLNCAKRNLDTEEEVQHVRDWIYDLIYSNDYTPEDHMMEQELL